jgi:exopolysaccharide production protein ExoQ
MPKASTHSFELGRASSFAPTIDAYVIVPIAACVYAAIVSPLLIYVTTDPATSIIDPALHHAMAEAPRAENKIFWPALAAISAVLVIRNWSRFTLPPHIICLFAYLALAGASVLWAFKPDLSFIRFTQQAMILTSIVLPAMLAARTADMMRALFLCFAFASILNVFFVLDRPLSASNNENFGYAGYLADKNSMGQLAAIAFFLALHEIFYSGRRRAFGIIVVVIATLLVFLSNSKTSLGLAFCAPFLAGLTLIIGRKMRISSATILLSILICYALLSKVTGFNMSRVSYMLYSNPHFSGRIYLWDFVQSEIARRPLLGWGYQSFWFVGPDGPSIVDASGWIRVMPHAHNGYLDVRLETGVIGFALFVSFIITTLYAIGRVAHRDPARAWIMLTLALFAILGNFLETVWVRGFSFLWVVFLIIAAEAGRYSRPFLPTRAAYGSRTPRPGSPGLSRGLRPLDSHKNPPP